MCHGNAVVVAFFVALCLVLDAPAFAQQKMSAAELAKISANPIANLVTAQFQNNTNFKYGPLEGTQNVFNIEPVIPISLSRDWNLITRTILPIITQPGFTAGQSSTTGLGDLQFNAFISPNAATALTWGVGPIVQAPTNSNDRLGNDRWGLGPTAIVVHLDKDSPWVYGALANNVWSVGGGSDAKYNNFTLQPFLHYNLSDGWYVNSTPIITANWEASGSQRWTVPLGGGGGKVFRIGKLPVNVQLGAYWNVIAPDNGPAWQLRLQVQLMFPE